MTIFYVKYCEELDHLMSYRAKRDVKRIMFHNVGGIWTISGFSFGNPKPSRPFLSKSYLILRGLWS